MRASQMTQSQAKAADALLAWYEAMGVDEAIGDVPVDRFAAPLVIAPPAARPERKRSTPNPVQPAGPAAPTLQALQEMIASFEDCALKRTAKTLCFARGSEAAKIMLIGEAPGRDEDLHGKPFVGRAGQLLDRMLAAIGLDESQVYITNTVYWRPPGNRTPTPQEALVCRPFLERQIELVGPKLILTLGGPATKEILGLEEGIMRLRGKWRDFPASSAPLRVMPTLHPAYLLRSPAAKRMTWRDLLALKTALDAKT